MGGLLEDMQQEIELQQVIRRPANQLFVTKDSGKREQFDSGMVRDTQDGKIDYTLAFDGPLARIMFGDDKTVAAFLNWWEAPSTETAEAFIFLLAQEVGGYAILFDRYAELMNRGALKYGERNWMKARGEAEYRRFRASAARHFIQHKRGQTDEDHAAAVLFNINGATHVEAQMNPRERAA